MWKDKLIIPTRNEFHREPDEILTVEDFCTCRPNINRIRHLPFSNTEKEHKEKIKKISEEE